MGKRPLRHRRNLALGSGAELFYAKPIEIVRGDGVYLYGSDGRRYVDMYNNVPCVGHANPVVVKAMAEQQATVNVHSRYLHEGIVTFAERAVFLRKRQDIRKALRAYGETPDNFSLIHADLDPSNIVKHGDDMALIDFDDSAYGWHMYDIASVLIEYRSRSDFDALSAALLDGYRELRSWEKRDIEMLPAFLLIRGMAIIGWYHQRPEHADSEYLDELKNWALDA